MINYLKYTIIKKKTIKKKYTIGIFISSLKKGGAERFVVEISRYLNDNYRWILFLSNEYKENVYACNHLEIICVGHTYTTNQDYFINQIKSKELDLFWDHSSCRIDSSKRQLLKKLKLNNIKTAITFHNSFNIDYYISKESFEDPIAVFKRTLDVLQYYDKIFVLNPISRDVFSKFLKNVEYIPNFPPEKVGGDDNKLITVRKVIKIGTLSNMDRDEKRIDLIYKVYSILKRKRYEIELYIGGKYNVYKDFAYRKFYNLELNDKNIFHYGIVDDVNKFYKNLDLFLLTSATESMPLVILEAASHKIPTIAFNLDGFSEIIINNKSGLLIDEYDIDKFIEAIEFFIDNPKLIKEYGQKAYNHCKNKFNIHSSASAYNKAFLDLIYEKEKRIIRNEENNFDIEYYETSISSYIKSELFIKNLNSNKIPPLLSILIPIYNVIKNGFDKNLVHLIGELRKVNLTFGWEVVIFNDGSNDDTKEFLDENYLNFKNIRIIHNIENKGTYFARSTLIREANGYYFIFCDSDDRIEISKLQFMIDSMLIDNLDILDTGAHIFDKKKEENVYPKLANTNKVFNKILKNEFLDKKIFVSLWGKVFRREIFSVYKLDDLIKENITIVEDFVRLFFLLENKLVYKAIKNNFYKYNKKESSISREAGNLNLVKQKCLLLLDSYSYIYMKRKYKLSIKEINFLEEKFYEDLIYLTSFYLDKHQSEIELINNLRSNILKKFKDLTEKKIN